MSGFSRAKMHSSATALAAALFLTSCGGGGGSSSPSGPIGQPPSPPPVQTSQTDIDTKAEAAQFLRSAGFGGVEASVDTLTGGNAADWVKSQIAMPAENYHGKISALISEEDARSRHLTQQIYESMIATDAELRARMTFALSQIFVINDSDLSNEGYGLAKWYDTLDRNAFGNYRDLMEEVTYSPVMGKFLTYLYNRKGDEKKGRLPDENYAREILQLFTIGLVELNMDGTPKLGADGQNIDTYDNEDVIGLARVFTGLVMAGTSHRWQDRYEDTWERPMMIHENDHSPLEKRFLGTVIPENTPADRSIDLALDAIFEHPNVAPFVSRQLIQRFTASDPEPAYVARVSQAFETGRFTADNDEVFGTGRRGDLAATIAAVLLDPSQHDDVVTVREGKVREPVLNFVNFARTYRSPPVRLVSPDWNRVSSTSGISDGLAQQPLRPPSVFNFYRPGFKAPGTETGEADLTAPELQIVNEGSALGYLNFMFEFIGRKPDHWDPTLIPDFDEEIAVANDASALVDMMELKLTAGRLNAETRQTIVEAVEALPIRENKNAEDRRSRVNIAAMMLVSSAEYMSVN